MLKFIEDVPPQFLMTREEMEEDLMQEYFDTDMTWDEMMEEMETIKGMYDE